MIQQPAVTIERIKLRRRVITFPSKPRLGGAAARASRGGPSSHAWPIMDAASARPHDWS